MSQDQASKDRALQALSSMSSAQIVSATSLHNNKGLAPGLPPMLYPHMSQLGPAYPPYGSSSSVQVTYRGPRCCMRLHVADVNLGNPERFLTDSSPQPGACLAGMSLHLFCFVGLSFLSGPLLLALWLLAFACSFACALLPIFYIRTRAPGNVSYTACRQCRPLRSFRRPPFIAGQLPPQRWPACSTRLSRCCHRLFRNSTY